MNKNLISSLVMLLFSCFLMAQNSEITGSWKGAIFVGNDHLNLMLHIRAQSNGLTATLDSPDQMALGIPVESVDFTNDTLVLKLPALQAGYQGILINKNQIEGRWTQAGMTFDLNLIRITDETEGPLRPQLPVPPYPYATEEVSIQNPNTGVTLAGTLTIPRGRGPHPAILLISGSGPQNRDEEIAGHKPFLVLADFLTRNGIATLRYDDRGVAGSSGAFEGATTVDFMHDAEAAFQYLLAQGRIDRNRCGLVGHSEGGMIAQMMAASQKEVRFIVLLAAPGVPTHELMLTQARLIAKTQGASENEIKFSGESNSAIFDILRNENDLDVARELVNIEMERLAENLSGQDTARKSMLTEQLISGVESVFTPWFLFFINYDPAEYLSNVKCPVLALNGGKDVQVEAISNLEAIKHTLEASGNKQVTTKLFPELNHLFQTAKTGAPREYAQIEETFSEEAMQLISDWIKKR